MERDKNLLHEFSRGSQSAGESGKFIVHQKMKSAIGNKKQDTHEVPGEEVAPLS
jgi:hypothetical protein